MRKPQVILISGKIKSGKDTARKHIEKELRNKNVFYKNIKFALPIKKMCGALVNKNLHEMEKREVKNAIYEELGGIPMRDFQQALGQALKKKLGDQIYAQIAAYEVYSQWRNLKQSTFIIDDWRFDFELSYFMNLLSTKYKIYDDVEDAEEHMHTLRINLSDSRLKVVKHEIAKAYVEENYTKSGGGLWLPRILELGYDYADKITSEISETQLDAHVGQGYFDLEVFNGTEVQFDAAMLTIRDYVKQKEW